MKSTNFSSKTRVFTGNVDTEDDDIILSEDPIYSTDPIMNVNLKVLLSTIISCITLNLAYTLCSPVNIYKGKSKIFKYNTENTNPITLGAGTLEEMKSFMYLDNIIDEQGGSDANVKSQSSIQTLSQFYCTGLKPGELPQLSSKKYKYL
ncbi:unnamed protein product [Schistosoma mattheei]|uniref:Uncharacterized protein n=1 Tax=Schistosoma mattheei TaxID=31246 RepID=A0A183P1D9_9TREM|nr:unnamed protein product [Schistosoma mattheei]